LLLSFCFNLHCQLHHNLICYELYWKRRCAIDCVPKSTQVNDLARLQMGNSSYWFVWWCNTLYNCWIAFVLIRNLHPMWCNSNNLLRRKRSSRKTSIMPQSLIKKYFYNLIFVWYNIYIILYILIFAFFYFAMHYNYINLFLLVLLHLD